MLRFSTRRLAFLSSTSTVLCQICASVSGEHGTSPFTSKIARRSQKDAGAEMAHTFAEKFAQHHKSKSETEIDHELKLREKANFKDATNHSAGDQKQMDGLRKRLIFQSRYRGMAELDLILGSFAQEALPSATHEELVEYDVVLRELDTDLFHWLVTIPGRKKDGLSGLSHSKRTAQSILSGSSDYSEIDKKASSSSILGSTPTIEDEFVEPKELLEAEWHRRDDVSEALKKNSMWKKLGNFVENDRNSIVSFR